MKIKIERSTIIKPLYNKHSPPPTTTQCTPLSIFDTISLNAHMAVIYAYKPPTPPTRTLRLGLEKTLAVYPEWAGRLSKDDSGNLVVLHNDHGIRFVEASANLDLAMRLKPNSDLLKLHPDLNEVEELLQVQVTRFGCGSMVIGFTTHHLMGDGQTASSFLVAWGKACRGLGITPLLFRDRSIMSPRNPPLYQFNHKGVEFDSSTTIDHVSESDGDNPNDEVDLCRVLLHKVHFTKEFLGKLKATASISNGTPLDKPYSTFECLMAHLWRVITVSCKLEGNESTQIRISVNGRSRLLSPSVANSYFGNLVLRAYPTTTVQNLISQPLSYATSIIQNSIARINADYFQSFIGYATCRAPQENLVPIPYCHKGASACPDVEVDCWVNIPFQDLDFGEGSPFIFMPSYNLPYEGSMYILPTCIGDGSIEVFVYLFEENVTMFEEVCYNI